MFTLSTSFYLPPTSVSYLTTSIEIYRHAITLTDTTTLQLDAGYNLAQALLELGEVLEDRHPERKDQVRTLREEARDILEQIYTGQEEYINSTAEDLEIDQASEIIEEKETEVDTNMEVDNEEQATFESHVPTPSSFIDTALLLVDTHLTLWTTAIPSDPPSGPQQTTVRLILDRAAKLVPAGRQAELDLAEIKVLLAMDEIVWEVFKADARIGTGIEKSLEGAVGALGSLLSSLDIQPADGPTLRAEILTTLAETHSTIAFRMLYLSPQLPPGPSPLAQSAWFNLSQAVTHLGKALDLPSHADTPKTFKPNVLLELSRASLARAKLSGVNDTAKRNLSQLLDNASTYVTRAADLLGWGGARSVGFVPPHPAGWDTEWLAGSVLLQQIRIGHTAKALSAELGQKYEKQATDLEGRLGKLPEGRRLASGDIERWVTQLEDEEEGVTEEEKEVWRGIASGL